MRGLFYIVLIAALATAQLVPDPAFTGSGKYVTIFDDPGGLDVANDEKHKEYSNTFAVSIIGSNSDTTTFAYLRTILDDLKNSYANTITIGPTTLIYTGFRTATEAFLNYTTTSIDPYFKVRCSYGGTTSVACTSTSIGVGSSSVLINIRTTTTVRMGTYQLVDRVATATNSSSISNSSSSSLQITSTSTGSQMTTSTTTSAILETATTATARSNGAREKGNAAVLLILSSLIISVLCL